MKNQSARGRPRNFDAQAKLSSISRVFREKGFDATSLDDIAAATQLSRPSLYAAYGDKQSMFLLTVADFAEQMRQIAVDAATSGVDLQECLQQFYHGALNLYFASAKRPLGCLLLSTAIVNASNNTDIRRAINQLLGQMDENLTELLIERCPELTIVQARELAQLAGGLLMNLSTRARAGTRRAELNQLAVASARIVAQSAMR